MRAPQRDRSMRVKMLVFICVCVASTMAIVFARSEARTRDLRWSLLVGTLDSETERTAAILADQIREGDGAEVERILVDALRLPLIVGATLFDAEGRQVLNFSAGGAPHAMRTTRRPVVRRDVGGDREIGAVELVATLDPFHDAVRADRAAGLAQIAALLAGVMLLVELSLRRVFRPLERISATLRALGEGRIDVTIPHAGDRNEIGQMARAAGVFRDTTRELVRLKRDLEAEVAEQTRQLRRERDRAEAANRAKSQFLAVMSHELRTPLTAIIGFAELLETSPCEASHVRHARLIRASGETLLAQINDILDLSAIGAGALRLSEDWVDLRAFFEELAETWRLEFESAGLSLDLRCAIADGLEALTDRTRLRQVVSNLLDNARKFTAEGGAALTVAAVRPDAPGARLRVDVAVVDTGPGPPEGTDVFDRFVQADADLGRRHGGVGLGLSISAEIVRRMGGGIEMRPAPGGRGGAEVAFHIQCRDWRTAAAASPAPARADVPDGPVLAGLRLLAADDNAVGREVLRGVLTARGARVRLVANGAEAAAAAAAQTYDAILLDLRMPVMDGAAAARAIRAARGGGGPPILAVSADPAELDEAEAGLFAAVISKPYRPAEMVAAVRACAGTPPAASAAS